MKKVICNNCHGAGFTYPKYWMGMNAPPPTECTPCGGTGEREVQKATF